MWRTIVQVLDTLLDRLIAGFIDTGIRFPMLTAAFLIVLVALAVALWVDALSGAAARAGSTAEATEPAGAQPRANPPAGTPAAITLRRTAVPGEDIANGT